MLHQAYLSIHKNPSLQRINMRHPRLL